MTFVKLILAKNRAPFYLRANLVRSVERNAEEPSQTIIVLDIAGMGQTAYGIANSVETTMAAVLQALERTTPGYVTAEEGVNEPLPTVIEEQADPRFRSKLAAKHSSS